VWGWVFVFVLSVGCLSSGLLLVVLVVVFGVWLLWGWGFCFWCGVLWWFFGLWVSIGFSGLCCFLFLVCFWFVFGLSLKFVWCYGLCSGCFLARFLGSVYVF
jgi:hypothetical protein